MSDWKMSSHSTYNGNCVQWRKSSHSSHNGQCVEFRGQEAAHLRDSKDPGGPVLSFGGSTWGKFLAAVKSGSTWG
jgi:hypothetical protein